MTAASKDAPKEWELRLYIAGKTPRAIAALENLQRICEEHLAGEYEIEVIDLLEESATGEGRPDSRRADTCQAGPPALAKDHR